jgi:hypothetical protein
MPESLAYNERTGGTLATPAPALTMKPNGAVPMASASLVRRCCTCKATKPLKDFGLNRSDPLGRQPRYYESARATCGIDLLRSLQ